MIISKKKSFTLIALVLFSIITFNPIYGFNMWLQHIGSLLLFALLWLDIKKNIYTWTGYLGIVAFTALHVFGARWCYTMVPYDVFCKEWISWSPNAYFNWTRNHYDRLVHFSFGLFIAKATKDYFFKTFKFSDQQSWLVAWLCINCFSMIYELFEWSLTFALAPDQVESYNGQQGDLWDPHKDMALALLGVSITWGVDTFLSLRRNK